MDNPKGLGRNDRRRTGLQRLHRSLGITLSLEERCIIPLVRCTAAQQDNHRGSLNAKSFKSGGSESEVMVDPRKSHQWVPGGPKWVKTAYLGLLTVLKRSGALKNLTKVYKYCICLTSVAKVMPPTRFWGPLAPGSRSRPGPASGGSRAAQNGSKPLSWAF